MCLQWVSLSISFSVHLKIFIFHESSILSSLLWRFSNQWSWLTESSHPHIISFTNAFHFMAQLLWNCRFVILIWWTSSLLFVDTCWSSSARWSTGDNGNHAGGLGTAKTDSKLSKSSDIHFHSFIIIKGNTIQYMLKFISYLGKYTTWGKVQKEGNVH